MKSFATLLTAAVLAIATVSTSAQAMTQGVSGSNPRPWTNGVSGSNPRPWTNGVSGSNPRPWGNTTTAPAPQTSTDTGSVLSTVLTLLGISGN